MKIGVVANGAREHALLWKLAQNKTATLFNFGSATNPGIVALGVDITIGEVTDVIEAVEWAKGKELDVVWIGPEAPLAAGIVDALEGVGIACVGPTQKLAQLESSKSFTRTLLEKYDIDASPAYQVFTTMDGIDDFIMSQKDQIVVKPDGLTGGKGVRVMGDHFHTAKEAIAYCQELFKDGAYQVVLEEKLVGQEFSLISFSDGLNLAHTPVVQDHKRAHDGDKGPNTGGMGTYSMPDHLLPFISEEDILRAKQINQATLYAIGKEFSEEFKGIMYGGFVAVNGGVKLIEYNARFGDPEVMNILSLLETDLVDITKAILDRSLDRLDVTFSNKASVCKYVVPEGYPDAPVKDQPIDVSGVDETKVNMFYGSVDATDAGLVEKGSRTIAITGIADTLEEAEQLAEAEIQNITGPLFHRKDIGTDALIQTRIDMMKEVRSSD